MKTLLTSFVLAALSLCFCPTTSPADEVKIDPDRYGALSYSPKTGKYGYSWNHTTRAAAEKAALAECKADDAKIVTWVKFGWAALVIAEDNAYGFEEVHGDSVTDKDAYEGALKELRKHSQAKVKTIVIICSGDVKPKITNK